MDFLFVGVALLWSVTTVWGLLSILHVLRTMERGNRIRHRQLLRQIADPSDPCVIQDIYEGDLPL
jgi:hypothetical protein